MMNLLEKENDTPIYVIIESSKLTGLEGIDFVTLDLEKAKNRIIEYHKKHIDAVNHRKEVLDKYGYDEDEHYDTKWDYMFYNDEISSEEYDNSKRDKSESLFILKFSGDKSEPINL